MGVMEEAGKAISRIKLEKPLVHQITNYVTANDCANITLAIGASPVMADDVAEMEEITGSAKALVLNMGTLTQSRLEAMLVAGKAANENGIPVILDPVGVCASSHRLIAVKELIRELEISIVRGNYAEMKALHGLKAACSGVDSLEQYHSRDILAVASELARRLETIVVATGETDIVTDGTRAVEIHNGSRMMAGITGMGCMCTALIGAFSAVCTDPYLSASAGVLTTAIAGELAYAKVSGLHEGLGSYKVRFLDEVYFLDEDIIQKRAKIIDLAI